MDDPVSPTESLRALEARCERAESANEALLASLGHELRTPLTAILLWAGSLRGREVAGAELAQALDAIVASAQSQSRRIDDLFDLSRMAARKLILTPRAVALDVLARNAREELRVLAASKQVALELTLSENLGTIKVDPQRLRRVLLALLSNAISFTPRGGCVTLRAQRSAEAIQIDVSDTGQGIAPDLLPHVFERFQHPAGREPHRPAGLGIGLALSRGLVELHGGTLEIQSAGIGHGTNVRILLPQPRVERSALLEPKWAPAALARTALFGLTVLVVEDDEGTREAMQIVLERAGMRVLTTEAGPEALALLDARAEAASGAQRLGPTDPAGYGQVDVILCDITLPGMSGYEFITMAVQACVRRGVRPPPACAVSAHAREVDRQRAIAAGFDLHVSKPLTAERLIEAVDDLCQVAAREAGRYAIQPTSERI